MVNERSQIPLEFEHFFWDVHVKDIDLANNKRFVIERLLNEGDHHTLKWLFHIYSLEEIKKAVCESRSLTRKTARYWQAFFQLREEEMKCFYTSLMTPEDQS